MVRRTFAALAAAALLGPAGAVAAAPPLRIGIAARISPRESFVYYDRLLAFIGKQLGQRVEMVQYTTYGEMDLALEERSLDFAFICSGPYVRDRARFGVELLAAPSAHGQPFYYGYVIVPAGSPARTIADLRGKRFAFTDPKSNTGHLVPTYLVMRETGVDPETFFGATRYTGSHDRSIDEVNSGSVDGASVDSLVYDYVAKRSPARVANVRVLVKSIPFGIPPFVSTKGADPKLKQRLRQVLLAMHEDPEGRAILGGIMVDRFVVPSDADYESVREMETWLATRTRPEGRR
jgi:phosphonate transport system substrate-binding protein